MVNADLSKVFDESYEARYERDVGGADGLTRRLRKRYVELEGGRGRLEDGTLVWGLERDGDAIQCVVEALGLPADSRSSVRPNFPVFSEETFGRLAGEMGEKWAKQPWSLGFHWFPYLAIVEDQDQPRQPFVRAIRHVAKNLARWRGLG